MAADFMAARSDVGIEIVRKWAKALPIDATVLDLGAGDGWPVTRELVERGFDVFAVEASHTMADALETRLPDIRIAREPVETSQFFGRRFDAIIAIGLMFLLSEESQRRLIAKVANALKQEGRFLFSAPAQTCSWMDVLTGRTSRSLGLDKYRECLGTSGMELVATHLDAGGNHYLEAIRR